MADQLFDNDCATKAYTAYIDNDNQQALNEFLQLCNPMITVLAREYSRDSVVQDDLIQEANLKLLTIVNEARFDTKRGKMYSFLNGS